MTFLTCKNCEISIRVHKCNRQNNFSYILAETTTLIFKLMKTQRFQVIY